MSHKYPRGEFELPSVTTIIEDCTDKSFGLKQWSANQAVEWIREHCEGRLVGEGAFKYNVYIEDLEQARFAYKTVSQTALDVGSEVHGYVEEYLKNKMNGKFTDLQEYSCEQARNAFSAFLEWYHEHDIKPIALEQKVYGDCWAGTLDFAGMFDGKLYVIDWKSSKAHYPEMRYQVAAYRSAWDNLVSSDNEYGIGLYPKGCGVLRLDKETGLPDWKDTSKSYESDLKIFNAMLQLYMLRHPRISKGAGWKNT